MPRGVAHTLTSVPIGINLSSVRESLDSYNEVMRRFESSISYGHSTSHQGNARYEANSTSNVTSKYKIVYHNGTVKYAEADTEIDLVILLGGVLHVKVEVKTIEIFGRHEWGATAIIERCDIPSAKFLRPTEVPQERQNSHTVRPNYVYPITSTTRTTSN